MKNWLRLIQVASLSLLFAGQTHAQTIQLESILAVPLSRPVFVTNAGDGTHRLFILEQVGRIQVLQPGSDTPVAFLDIMDRVLFSGERGLLGLAFHPDYASNGRFFVHYTRQPDGWTVLSEFAVSGLDPDLGDATTEMVLLTLSQPFANHNGGMIAFGPDGMLYIALGDGGSGNDPGNRSQDLNLLYGKILRIDVNVPDGSSAPYLVPPDNPFYGATSGLDEIYAYGLRNPWRFSFDWLTGALYVGDVGQGQREEIDIVTSGGNYGWRVYEGSRCTGLDPDLCNPGDYLFPITEYTHGGGRCSVTGGYVYRGSQQTVAQGAYLFGDFCTGEIFMFAGGVQSVLLDTSLSISSFGEDEAGELYVASLGGDMYRIANPDAPSCPLPAPTGLFPVSAGVGLQPTFMWDAVADADDYTIEIVPTAHVFLGGDPPQVIGALPTNAYTPGAPLPAPDYAWKVAARNDACGLGLYSAPALFTPQGVCPLAAPVLTTPPAILPPLPELTWDAAPGSSIFVVFVIDANTHAIALQSFTTEASVMPDDPLEAGPYAWVVYAFNAVCGVSVASTPGLFIVE